MKNFGLDFKNALAGMVMTSIFFLSACGRYETGESPAPAPPAPVDVIKRVDNAATLDAYLKAGIRAQTGIHYLNDSCSLGMVCAVNSFDSTAGSSQNVSGTNLQEAGVDEADRIKSDGALLYVLNDSGAYQTDTSLELRIMRLAGTPAANATELSRLVLGTTVGGDGIYLFSANGSAGLDRLAVVGNSSSDNVVMPFWDSPWGWQNRGVDVTIVNVADPASPAIGTRLHIDGHLVATRRIGDMLYVVSRYVATVPGYQVYPATVDVRIQNELLLQAAPLTALLPNWKADGIDKGNLFAAEDCYLLPVAKEDYTPDMVTVTAINLRSPASTPKSTCMLGPSETLYASTEAIYLATTRYHYSRDDVATIMMYPAEMATDIHKFTITASGPELRGSASVPGHLGWHQDKKTFRLGEYQGVLRVVTSGGVWGGEEIRLTTLVEQNGALTELAHLPNAQRPARIGKVGEQLYAVRFVGNRGFIVTFRTVDPLYVLDLSDPADPFIAGELSIAGYSDYLHPVSETRLLGIGKDAIPVNGDGDGRGAWYQGVKISLFDISNPAAPQEIDSKVIGKRGTEAGALIDHHALAWLPTDPATNRPARLALPVELHETPGSYTSTDPSSFYSWTNRSLYMFDIDPIAPSGAITARGTLVVADQVSGQPWNSWVASDRALIAGDDVHYVHGSQVWSAVWGNPATMSAAQ